MWISSSETLLFNSVTTLGLTWETHALRRSASTRRLLIFRWITLNPLTAFYSHCNDISNEFECRVDIQPPPPYLVWSATNVATVADVTSCVAQRQSTKRAETAFVVHFRLGCGVVVLRTSVNLHSGWIYWPRFIRTSSRSVGVPSVYDTERRYHQTAGAAGPERNWLM